MIEIKNAIGKISINHYSGGSDTLFRQKNIGGNGLSINFLSAKMSDPDDNINEGYIFTDKTLARIFMTGEQWTELILNKDLEKGVPVTLRSDNNGSISLDSLKEEPSDYSDFKEKLNILFSSLRENVKNAHSTLTNQKKFLKKDKENLIEFFNLASADLMLNKSKMENLVEEYLINLDKTNQDTFVSQMKDFFQEEKLITYNKEDTAIENDYQGVLVFKSETNLKNTLVKDFEANNGISFTLYRAIVVNDEVVKTDELIKVFLSNSQFSELLVSFGGSNIDCTLKNVYGQKIDTFTENIDDSFLKVRKLWKHIDDIESDLDEIKKTFFENIDKNIASKLVNKELLFQYELIKRLAIGTFVFRAERVFEEGIKHIVRRREDIQGGVINKMHKEAVTQNKTKLLEDK